MVDTTFSIVEHSGHSIFKIDGAKNCFVYIFPAFKVVLLQDIGADEKSVKQTNTKEYVINCYICHRRPELQPVEISGKQHL